MDQILAIDKFTYPNGKVNSNYRLEDFKSLIYLYKIYRKRGFKPSNILNILLYFVNMIDVIKAVFRKINNKKSKVVSDLQRIKRWLENERFVRCMSKHFRRNNFASDPKRRLHWCLLRRIFDTLESLSSINVINKISELICS
jgi:hypothetical protein